MIKILLLSIIQGFCLSVKPTGATPYLEKPLQVNDIVYIHAPNGLTLRKTGAKDGTKVALVPFNGASLTVVSPPEPGVQYVAETIGGFAVKGGWVNVKTSEGLEGYLFEGYLSRYKPLNVNKLEGNVATMDGFYRTISPLKSKRTTLPSINGSTERYQYVYADGTRFEEQQFPGGGTQILDLPAEKFTLQEALVLFRTAWFGKEKTTGTYDTAKQRLTIIAEGGYTQLTIQPKGNRLVLRFETAD
ncbi:hypothetical protein GO730_16760 [Spirosoma sp. HMF3257]|uniref:SH3 domain-containing protein n=1 Tax=Spirosoma telluris TaxID=2183553 RepID=A0A327NJ20_9BACT|nr:hypothetical protein [Spirosoma telluris]RAI75401.1 hypothetical protein HMF3257_16690 [Spirosoma telluris]